MKKIALCVTVISLSMAISSNAQQASVNSKTENAVYAYANGDDSYLKFSRDSYKADRNYVVFKFWNAAAPLTEKEKTDLAYLEKHLTKRNIKMVQVEWKDEADLKAALQPYDIKVETANGKHINLKGSGYNLNTTSAKALFVVENNKPFSLCSGKECESNLKTFFKLQSYN